MFIKAIIGRLGLDGAIFFTSLARTIQAIGGIISLLFIAKYLTEVEQGFYYTFGSIVAIQIFFELGLNGIITQYVAHEVSHLSWKTSSLLSGDERFQSRLSSLLHFSIKWYLSFSLFLFVILLVVGFLFFSKYGENEGNVTWRIPWLLLAFGTSVNLFLTPMLAFLEGLGKVKEIAKVRLCQQCMVLLVIWLGLFFGGKLYVLGLSLLIGILTVFVLVFRGNLRSILLNIWSIPLGEQVNYRKEIFPYQWRIALSWISGYFIFQFFNPVLFATEGAIIAGQMGMTLAALNGIQSLSLSWMTTKIPLYSGLIAQHQYNQLDKIFNKSLKQCVFVNGVGLVLLFAMIYIFRYYNISIGSINLGNRFLSYLPLFLMMLPVLMNQYISSWAIYLRCHKKEPFLIHAIVGGITCSLSTILLGKIYGILGITFGYCFVTVILFIWGYNIYRINKAKWHQF